MELPQSNYKYPYFWMRPEWVEYIETLNPSEDVALLMAIAEYGLNADEPQRLTPRALDYFNAEVRPHLDADHRKHDRATNKQKQTNSTKNKQK